jgi:uncharacterized protein YjdB
MSVALREQRILVYAAQDAGYTEGCAATSYAVQPSVDDDGAWWASFVQLDPFSLSNALQQEQGVRAKANVSQEVPVTETSLIRDLATGRLYKVEGVNDLPRTDARIVACEWREDAAYTITEDVPAYTVDSLTVSPAAPALAVGESVHFTATALNADGAEIPGPTPVWESSAPAVVMMMATGVGEALGAGSATITATMGAVSGTATATVT